MSDEDQFDDVDEADPADALDAINERYLATLAEQSDLRQRGQEAIRSADPPSSSNAIREVLADHADRFDGDLVVLAAIDFGYPAAFVPEGTDPAAALNRLLDELHRESGKWREDEALAPVRAGVRDAEPMAHKVLPAVLAGGDVRYDLPSGTDSRANFVTIRQAVGLVDWVANSYQAEQLTIRY